MKVLLFSRWDIPLLIVQRIIIISTNKNDEDMVRQIENATSY